MRKWVQTSDCYSSLHRIYYACNSLPRQMQENYYNPKKSVLYLPLLGFSLKGRRSKEAKETVRLDEWEVVCFGLPHNWQRQRAKPVRVPQHCSCSPMEGNSNNSMEPSRRQIRGLQLTGMATLAWRQRTTAAIKHLFSDDPQGLGHVAVSFQIHAGDLYNLIVVIWKEHYLNVS